MKYYKNDLVLKETGETVRHQKGYTKDIETARARFAKQNSNKGIYEVTNIEEITKEEYAELPREW